VRFTMTFRRVAIKGFVLSMAGLVTADAARHDLRAEGAFVDQAAAGSATRQMAPVISMPAAVPMRYQVPRPSTAMAPEAMATVPSVGNVATTLEIGKNNRVLQTQVGAGNISNIGIVKGVDNSVGVLQAGNNLKSNLVLVNTAGLSIGVIQPAGSAPVNMLIARLPNGGLMIKR
jgi:hypothetical protein